MIYNHGGFSLSKSYFPMAKNHPNWSQLVGTRALPIDQKTPPVIGLPSEKGRIYLMFLDIVGTS
jgi:hypothetical protein